MSAPAITAGEPAPRIGPAPGGLVARELARAVGGAVIAVIVDKFETPAGAAAVAGNEPALSRGRPARIRIP